MPSGCNGDRRGSTDGDNCVFEQSTYVPINVSLAATPHFSNPTFINNFLNGIEILSPSSSFEVGDYALEPTNEGDGTAIAYLVTNGLFIPTHVTLTILPGVIIKLLGGWGDGSALSISGRILAEGTGGEPIVFTSAQDDIYGGDSNNNGPTPPFEGAWSNIRLYSSDSACVFKHCQFRYAGDFSPSNPTPA